MFNSPKPTGLGPVRETAANHLGEILKTSRSHPDPEQGKLIRMTCTQAILALMVARSPEQVDSIYRKALADLNQKAAA